MHYAPKSSASKRPEPDTMLALLFSIGTERYAIRARGVLAVVPDVALRAAPGTPRGVAGILAYGGQLVPVVDLAQMLAAESARARLSTRIVVAHYESGPDGALIGLRVEQAGDAEDIPESAMVDPLLHARDAPWLGALARHQGELLQIVEIAHLLSTELRAALYPTAGKP